MHMHAYSIKNKQKKTNKKAQLCKKMFDFFFYLSDSVIEIFGLVFISDNTTL